MADYDDVPKPEPSLRETLVRNNELLEQLTGNKNGKKRGKKPFKLPITKTFFAGPKIKKGYVLYLTIGINHKLKFEWVAVDDAMAKDKKGLYHAVTSGDVYFYKRIPVVIQPEWSLRAYSPSLKDTEPFSARQNFSQTIANKELSYPQRVIIEQAERRALKMEGKKKGKFSMLIWVGLGIAVIVVGYLLFSGGSISKVLGG